MNTELWLDHKITGSNKHGKSAKDISFTDLVKLLDMAETASGSNVQSKKSICYRNLTWRNKECSILINAYDKSPSLTIRQKGPEDMMATM